MAPVSCGWAMDSLSDASPRVGMHSHQPEAVRQLIASRMQCSGWQVHICHMQVIDEVAVKCRQHVEARKCWRPAWIPGAHVQKLQ